MEEKNFLELEDINSCQGCNKGIGFCSRACWPIPSEVKKLMEAGHGSRLMLDAWTGANPIFIICPATPNYEGKDAPGLYDDNPFSMLLGASEDPLRGGCTFHDEETKNCTLHDTGLKPLEGRKTCCKVKLPNIHKDVAMSWNTDEGRSVVEEWKKNYYNKI
jgi:hypothetical protein